MAWTGIRPLAIELPAGVADGGPEPRGPQVLEDEDGAQGARLHDLAEGEDVLLGQGLGQLRLEPGELTHVLEIAQLLGHDGPVGALADQDQVHHPDDPGVVEPEQLFGRFAREVLLPCRELDHQVVDGPELVEQSFSHKSSKSRPASSHPVWSSSR